MNKTSENFTKIMISFEAEKLVGYRDSVGLPTVGIGHLIKAGESYGVGKSITLEESRRLFAEDSQWAKNAVNRVVLVPLTQNQFDALCSLCFNIGERAFKNSTMVKKINLLDYKGAARAFLSWVYANGKVSKGLMNRRVKEKALFEKP